MTTPGQQLDQNTTDINLLSAKVQGLREQQAQDGQHISQNMSAIGVLEDMVGQLDIRLSNVEEWQSQCDCGTVDIEPPVVTPEPPPEPTEPPAYPYSGIPHDLLDLPQNYRDKENRTDACISYTGTVQDGHGGIAHHFQRVLIDGGEYTGDGSHWGFALNEVDEVYAVNATLRGLQHFYQPNGDGNVKTVARNLNMYDVGGDAFRNITGLIENCTVHSAKPVTGEHGDTIDLKHFTDGLTIRNLQSTSGKIHGIITAGVKNIVIDGFEHVPAGTAKWSMQFNGPAENVTIRNCKLGGNIIFSGSKTNINIDWNTVRINVPREEFA